MNPCDKAQDVELAEWEALQRNAIRPEATRPSALNCIDCGDPIPEDRRNASKGCERCAECQRDFEYREKQGRQRGRPA